MKILYLVRCIDCPHFWRTPPDGPNRCTKQTNIDTIFGKPFHMEFDESSNIPDWCPLPNRAQQQDSADVCRCSACGLEYDGEQRVSWRCSRCN